MKSIGRRARALAAVGILVLAAGCSSRANEAMRLLTDIAAMNGSSDLEAQTPEPVRETVRIAVEDGTIDADVYRLPTGTAAAMVLVPGAAEAGRRDSRLVALARSLSRVEFLVVVPELSGLRDLEVGSGNVDEIVSVVEWSSAGGGGARPGPVAIGAFSYAVGPVLMAATDPEIADDISVLVSVGGYHDIERVVAFATTGYFRAEGEWRHLEPNPRARWAFLASNARRLENESDRATLRAIASRKIADPQAAVDELAAGLGPCGRAVYALLTNDDPRQVPELIDALPASIRAEMRALDPSSHDLSDLQAEALLIHGRSDTVTPYTESLHLDEALPPEQASLYLVDGLFHVDVDFSLADKLTLWDAAIALLAARDRIAREASP